jgi:hypothetical protein
MKDVLERPGERMLSLFAPRTRASAAGCWEQDCPSDSNKCYRQTCCSNPVTTR